MLREYIGEEGGLEEIETLDEEDVQELGAPCLALPSFFLSFFLSVCLSFFPPSAIIPSPCAPSCPVASRLRARCPSRGPNGDLRERARYPPRGMIVLPTWPAARADDSALCSVLPSTLFCPLPQRGTWLRTINRPTQQRWQRWARATRPMPSKLFKALSRTLERRRRPQPRSLSPRRPEQLSGVQWPVASGGLLS